MPNKDWKDCSITINFPDSQSLNLFARYVGRLPEYMEMWTLNEDEKKKVDAFCEVMSPDEVDKVTISSPLIDGGDDKTIFGMEKYLEQGLRVRTMREYTDYFASLSKEAK
tara:strand:- start:314 stop:643 length:330 start_codon:yes stop_codon:yes gene_type:complete